jgi:hypothetical protein
MAQQRELQDGVIAAVPAAKSVDPPNSPPYLFQ